MRSDACLLDQKTGAMWRVKVKRKQLRQSKRLIFIIAAFLSNGVSFFSIGQTLEIATTW